MYENKEVVSVRKFRNAFSAKRFVSELSLTMSNNEDRTGIITSHHLKFCSENDVSLLVCS